MNANELRIGNLIHYKSGQAVDEWTVVEELSLTDLHEVNDIRISSFSPIPLSEAWLVKFGFDNIGGCYNLSRLKELGHIFGDFAVSKYDDTQMRVWRGDRYIGICHIQYVHQLQNLYFALTGEELTLK